MSVCKLQLRVHWSIKVAFRHMHSDFVRAFSAEQRSQILVVVCSNTRLKSGTNMKSIAALIVLGAAVASAKSVCDSARSCASSVTSAISTLQPERPLSPGQQSAIGIAQRMLQPTLKEATDSHFGDGGGSDVDTEWCPNKSCVTFCTALRIGIF